MIKNIIFDIGSVIAYFNKDKVLATFTPNKDEQEFLRENVIYSPEWNQYGHIDLGYISLEDMGNIICDRTDHVHDDLVMDFSVNHVNFIEVQQSMINLINNLRKNGYKVYILSNTNKNAMKKHDESNLTNIVDGHVYSYEVKMIKPHIGIYKELINKYNLVPSECVFIDDRKENTDTADRLGIHGENVVPDNYESVIAALNKYNIKID